MLAIFVTTASYLAFAVLAGATVVRDATGPGPFNGSEDWDETFEGFRNCYLHNETTGSTDFICSDWGLMNSFQVIKFYFLMNNIKFLLCKKLNLLGYGVGVSLGTIDLCWV